MKVQYPVQQNSIVNLYVQPYLLVHFYDKRNVNSPVFWAKQS